MIRTGFEGIRRRYDTSVFERSELSNGIPVWIQQSPILTDDGGELIIFLPGVGSQVDPIGTYGTAHFFEHLPFRGTKTKPSKELLVNPIKALGGDVNAMTGMQRTKYYVKLPREQFALAVETLYTMVLEPLLREEDVLGEIGVISQEYRRAYSNGDKLAFKIAVEFLYGKNHPLGHLSLGELESIRGMKTDSLKLFHSSWYHAGQFELVCGGAFSELDRLWLLGTLEKWFGSLPRTDRAQIVPDHSQLFGEKRHGIVYEPRCGRDVMAMIYPIPPKSENEDYALRFLSSAIAGDIDSPLMIELREKRGLVYESNLCWVQTSQDIWMFNVRLPVPVASFVEARSVFREVLEKLSADEFLRRQKQRQLERKLAFKDPISACHQAVEEIVDWGRPFSDHEIERGQDEITLDETFKWRDYLLEAEPFICEIMVSR